MGRYIVHHDGWFFEWSTGGDCPRTFGMRRADFEAWHRDEYGRDGSRDMDRRIARAVEFGCSVLDGDWSAEDGVSCNRAGFNESSLTLSEIVQIYCVEQRRPREGEGVETHDEESEAPA